MYARTILLSLLLAGLVAGTASAGPDPLAGRLQAAVRALLAERYPSEAGRLQVRILRAEGALDDLDEVRLYLRSGDGLPRGHTQADVLAPAADGSWKKVGWTLLYVAHYDSVVVPVRDLEAGTLLTPEDVSVIWLDVTTFRGQPLTATLFRRMQSEPTFATRTLRAGQALRTGDLRPPYAAHTGDAVVMLYRRGPVTLRLTCKAREAGFTGDLIRLYYPDATTTYRARLTGPGTAEWVETL
ncbi:MAG: flagella basal body P-ring formation protein FlgA [Bacteroidetes bacterium]|nr:MAG: flagella basal body P-ring formation protein FlgA [Bacteroidota bacterium]